MAATELCSGNLCQNVGVAGTCAVISAEGGGAACRGWKNGEKMTSNKQRSKCARTEGVRVQKKGGGEWQNVGDRCRRGECQQVGDRNSKTLIWTEFKRVMSK